MSKPLIGINTDYRSAKNESPAFSYVAAGYYEAVLQAGGLPVLLPSYEDEADLEQVLDRLDGVLLIGGADLDPRRDGWMLHPTVRLQDSRGVPAARPARGYDSTAVILMGPPPGTRTYVLRATETTETTEPPETTETTD